MAVTVTVGDNPVKNTAGTAKGDAVTMNYSTAKDG